ncbi:MAG: hypothetical protein Q4G08_08720 [Capnocytophaga sp.]|nr:hypothetical protein [Capnocytophaga sp.]
MKKEYLLKVDESHPSSADFIKFLKSLDFVRMTKYKKASDASKSKKNNSDKKLKPAV